MYHIEIREDVAKAIVKLPGRMRVSVYDSIASLASNPRPP